jgi:prepilin-type processing-associated H-X9-DG protein
MQSIRIIPIMRGRRGARGLSLIELATAIAAVAVLAGVTLVSLGGVRTASQREVCLNNLRRIAAASADYSADDPRDNAIPVHRLALGVGGAVIGDYQYGGKSGNVDHAAYYYYTIEGNFGTYTRPLNPRLYDVNSLVSPECRDYTTLTQACLDADKVVDVPMYRCPSDTGKTGLHYGHWGDSHRTAYDYFGTSYNANVSMVCDFSSSSDAMQSNSPFLRPRDAVPNPARTISYMETNGRFAWTWGYAPFPYGTNFTVGGWHGEDWRFNAAFVDGHVQTITMRGAADGGEVNSAADAEYVPGLPGGIVNWWQVITRGPDWQLDTLPSLPIDTSKRCALGAGEPAGGGSNVRPAELTP